MSRLEELIAEYCPDGVEYYSFGEIAEIVRGASPRPIKNFITTDKQGVNWIKIGDVKPGEKYISKTEEKITPDGAQKSRFVQPGDFILSNSMSYGRPYILKIAGCIHDGWLAVRNYQQYFDTDFLYHLLNSNSIQTEMKKRASFGGAVQNLNADIVRALILPVPPLPVQREIVRILDNFTERVMNLQNQLTAELTARKKQYEYYLETAILSCRTAQKCRLSEVCAIFDGTHQTPEYKISGVRFVSVENIENLYGSEKFISQEAYERYKIKPQINDVLMTRITAGIIGKCTVIDRAEPLAYYVSLALLRPNPKVLDSRYLKYYIESGYGKKELRRYILTDATPPKINKDAIGKVFLLLPSIDEQRRLVSSIQHFDVYCNELIIGLPSEIEARQKQYEYYRDKLLTFKEIKRE